MRRLVSSKAVECALSFSQSVRRERGCGSGSGSGSGFIEGCGPRHPTPSAPSAYDHTPGSKVTEGDATSRRRMSEDAGGLTGCAIDKEGIRGQLKN